MANKNLFENDNYSVMIIADAIGEDGQYGVTGYGVVNRKTGVVEMTTTILPSAISNADYYNTYLKALLNPPIPVAVTEDTTELRVVN